MYFDGMAKIEQRTNVHFPLLQVQTLPRSSVSGSWLHKMFCSMGFFFFSFYPPLVAVLKAQKTLMLLSCWFFFFFFLKDHWLTDGSTIKRRRSRYWPDLRCEGSERKADVFGSFIEMESWWVRRSKSQDYRIIRTKNTSKRKENINLIVCNKSLNQNILSRC